MASSPILKVTEDFQQVWAGDHWEQKLLAACIVEASNYRSRNLRTTYMHHQDVVMPCHNVYLTNSAYIQYIHSCKHADSLCLLNTIIENM